MQVALGYIVSWNSKQVTVDETSVSSLWCLVHISAERNVW